MNPYCIICNNKTSFLLKKDGYDIFECPSCKLSFVHPEPDQNFLNREVYSAESGYQGNKKSDLSSVIPVKKHQKVIDYLKHEKPGTFLDIGASNGEMMYNVQKMGYKVKGVELNSRTAQMAKSNNLEVFNGLLENAHYPDDYFDYVYMGDLIEHVTNPVFLLKETRRITKNGGQLIILTPNMDCFWAYATFFLYRLFRIPWSIITPPHHLYNFSINTLSDLLKKSGFKVIKVWYTGTPSLKYELGNLHLLKKWKNQKNIHNLFYMLFAFSLYTILFGLNRLIELFPVKEFAMAVVAEKI
jgi:SAM-dependent methyltransferase